MMLLIPVNVLITSYKEFDDYINWKGIETVFLTAKMRDPLGIKDPNSAFKFSRSRRQERNTAIQVCTILESMAML